MSIRILIADDHRMFRESLRLSLLESGQVEIVGEAGSGEETLREVARLKPDLILLDISLPDINGIDLARKLRQSFPDLKIIALTAHTDRLFVEAMLKSGAQGYLVKTASTKDLVTAIQMVAGGRNYLCVEAMQALVRRQGDEGKAELGPSSILGRRELEVLKLLAQGLASTLISARLNIAVGTVEVHRRNIMRKLGIHTAVDLTRYAIRKGLISA